MGIVTGLHTRGRWPSMLKPVATLQPPKPSSTPQPNTSPINQPGHPVLERETGIEPASLAWKAKVLPLNYSRLARPTPRVDHGHSLHGIGIRLVEEAGFEPA